MNIVISALHFRWDTVEECFDRVRNEFGLGGVELSWASSFRRPHCTEADSGRLREISAASGLALSAHIWENLARLDSHEAEAALLGWLDQCGPSHVTDVVIHGGSYPDRDEGIQRVKRVLARVLPRFERAGVVLNLENHYAYEYRECQELFSQPWEFREVFELDSPSLRFCFDTGHGHMTGNCAELIRELAPWLNYIHLADNHGEHDDHCMFRQGTVPWDRIFDTACDIGFDGTFCVEFPVREDPQPFRACVRELRERWHEH